MKQPSNCNCCKCTIKDEPFSVADGTDLEDVPGWHYMDQDCATGDPIVKAAEVQGGVLETTDSDFKAFAASGLPGSLIYEYIVEADVKGDDELDELELIAMSSSGERCYLVLVRLIVSDDCPYLQIWYHEHTPTTGPIDTLLREIPLPDAAVGEFHHLKACVLQNPVEYPYAGVAYSFRVLASVRTNIGTTRYVAADLDFIAERPIPGISTGDITTKAYFDNYEWTKHQRNGGTDGALNCPRCKVGDCEYSSDDFADGIDCVWKQNPLSTQFVATTYGAYDVAEAPSATAVMVHMIGHPYNRPYNSVEVWVMIDEPGETAAVRPVCDNYSFSGPTVYLTVGEDLGGEGCGYVQFGSVGAVHLPVQNAFAGVWIKLTVCYGWHPNGVSKILSVVVNDESVLPPPGRYQTEADDYDLPEFQTGSSGTGPMWYSALIHAAGTHPIRFRNFAVSMSYHPDPLLTGYYGSALTCPKCFDDADFCLWATELCVGPYSDCMVNDSGSWGCADLFVGCGISTALRGGSNSQRIWQIANPWLQTSQRAEGYVTANGECDQTVIVCYDQDSGDYVGLKFTWDTDCGKVEIVQNGSVITSHESQYFAPGSLFHFCFTQINGFCVAIVRSLDTDDCSYGYGVRLNAELPDPVIGIWCGAKTGTWVSPSISADFYDLVFQTARTEDYLECEVCFPCTVLSFPTSEAPLGCEWTGVTDSTHGTIASGESVATTFATLVEPDKAVVVLFQFTGYSQSFQVDIDGYWIRLEINAYGVGRCLTSEGDDVSSLSFPLPTSIFPFVRYEFRICVRSSFVRLQLGTAVDDCNVIWDQSNPIVSFKRTAGATWSNTLTLTASGGDVQYCALRVDYSYTCLKCHAVCEACDSFRLPSLAVLDAAFDTGNECCDFFEGIHYIEMDGCSGTGDSLETVCNFGVPIGARDIAGRWTVYLEQFVGYVRITAELLAQYDYPSPGVYHRWRCNVTSIRGPSENGVVDCTTLGRLTLNYEDQLYSGPCSSGGVSAYTGTVVYLELS